MNHFSKPGIAAAMLAATLLGGAALHGAFNPGVDSRQIPAGKLKGEIALTSNSLFTPTQSTTTQRRAPRANEGVETLNWNSVSSLYFGEESQLWSFDGETMSFTIEGASPVEGGYTTNLLCFQNTSDEYQWTIDPAYEYQFTGTITLESGSASVMAGVLYSDGYRFYFGPIVSGTIAEGENSFSVSVTEEAFGMTEEGESASGYTFYPGFMIYDNSEDAIVTFSNLSVKRIDLSGAAESYDPSNPIEGIGYSEEFGSDFYVATLEDDTKLGIYLDGWNSYLTGIVTESESIEIPYQFTTGNRTISLQELNIYDGRVDFSNATALRSIRFANGINRVYAEGFLNGSNVTDVWFDNSSVSCYSELRNDGQELFVHIPYGASRSSIANGDNIRVLIGDETPEMPAITDNYNFVIPAGEEGYVVVSGNTSNGFSIDRIICEGDSIALPSVTPWRDGRYYIRTFADNNYSLSYICSDAPALRKLTIPDSYTRLNPIWVSNEITDLYMGGLPPTLNYGMSSAMTVHVATPELYDAYKANSSWSSATIVPWGWEISWTVVDVKRGGEFAQTYLEENDNDWSVGRRVKVTGTVNALDLTNMARLTNLTDLDLSELELTAIPANFMQSKSKLMTVKLPLTVKTIGSQAFYYCSELTSINLENVEVIYDNAFYYCRKLNGIDIHATTYIGESVFYYCTLLSNITFPESLTYFGQSAFYSTALTEVTIPNGITTIPQNAFYETPLRSVTLNSDLKTIGRYAFYNTSIDSISIPEGVTSIEDDAFYNNRRLTYASLPSTLTSIGSSAFSNTGIKDLYCYASIPPSATSSFISGVNLNASTLHVPSFAVDIYRDASYWNEFFIIKPLNNPVNEIIVNRPVELNISEADSAALSAKPSLTIGYDPNNNSYWSIDKSKIGQLTTRGEGVFNAKYLEIRMLLDASRSGSSSSFYHRLPSLINYAEKMRTDTLITRMQFYSGNNWYFITFPYDVEFNDIEAHEDLSFVIRTYNGAQRALADNTVSNWRQLGEGDKLEAGKGYIIMVSAPSNISRTIVFPSRNSLTKNNMFTSNNVIIPLEEHIAEEAQNRSWNLVGNPYPCFYDMHSLLDDFSAPITLWNGSGYSAYSPIDDNIVLRPNESFFVQRPIDCEQMVFGADGRRHLSEISSVPNPGAMAPAQSLLRNVFNFNVEAGEISNRARVVINPEASRDYEIGRDAAKMFADQASLEIYVSDCGVNYDICERPLAEGTANLGVRAAGETMATIALDGRFEAGWQVMLRDNLTGAVTDLTSGQSYGFKAEGNDPARFTVTFLAPTTSLEEVMAAIDATATVRIFTLGGVEVFNGEFGHFAPQEGTVYLISTADGRTFKTLLR